MLTPDTTLREIAADEKLQLELAELILSNGLRGNMAGRRLSFDSADAIAQGIAPALDSGLDRLARQQAQA